MPDNGSLHLHTGHLVTWKCYFFPLEVSYGWGEEAWLQLPCFLHVTRNLVYYEEYPERFYFLIMCTFLHLCFSNCIWICSICYWKDYFTLSLEIIGSFVLTLHLKTVIQMLKINVFSHITSTDTCEILKIVTRIVFRASRLGKILNFKL